MPFQLFSRHKSILPLHLLLLYLFMLFIIQSQLYVMITSSFEPLVIDQPSINNYETPFLSSKLADAHSTVSTIPLNYNLHSLQVFSGQLYCNFGCSSGDVLILQPGLAFNSIFSLWISNITLVFYNQTTNDLLSPNITIQCQQDTCTPHIMEWYEPIESNKFITFQGYISFTQDQILGDFVRMQYFSLSQYNSLPQYLIIPILRSQILGASLYQVQGVFSPPLINNTNSPSIYINNETYHNQHVEYIQSTNNIENKNQESGSFYLQYDQLTEITYSLRVIFIGPVKLVISSLCKANGATVYDTLKDSSGQNFVFFLPNPIQIGASLTLECTDSLILTNQNILTNLTNNQLSIWVSTYFFPAPFSPTLSSTSSISVSSQLITYSTEEALYIIPQSYTSSGYTFCQWSVSYNNNNHNYNQSNHWPTYVNDDSYRLIYQADESTHVYTRMSTSNASQIILHDDHWSNHNGVFSLKRLHLDIKGSHYLNIAIFIPNTVYNTKDIVESYGSSSSSSSSSNSNNISSNSSSSSSSSSSSNIIDQSSNTNNTQLSQTEKMCRLDYTHSYNGLNIIYHSLSQVFSHLRLANEISMKLTQLSSLSSDSQYLSTNTTIITNKNKDIDENKDENMLTKKQSIYKWSPKFTLSSAQTSFTYLYIEPKFSDLAFEINSSSTNHNNNTKCFCNRPYQITPQMQDDLPMLLLIFNTTVLLNDSFTISCPTVHLKFNSFVKSPQDVLVKNQFFEFTTNTADLNQQTSYIVMIPPLSNENTNKLHPFVLFIELFIVVVILVIGVFIVRKIYLCRKKRVFDEEEDELLHDMHYKFIID